MQSTDNVKILFLKIIISFLNFCNESHPLIERDHIQKKFQKQNFNFIVRYDPLSKNTPFLVSPLPLRPLTPNIDNRYLIVITFACWTVELMTKIHHAFKI